MEMKIFQLALINPKKNGTEFSFIITPQIIVRTKCETRARQMAACAESLEPSPWLDRKITSCDIYPGNEFKINGEEVILFPVSLQAQWEINKPTNEKFEDLIKCVKSSEIFPTNTIFEKCGSYCYEISWCMDNDRNRKIQLLISSEALQDCKNLDKAKNNLKMFLRNRINFNLVHNVPERWTVTGSDLNTI